MQFTNEKLKLLWDRQRDRENLALTEGARQFKEQIAREAARGEYSRSGVGRLLVKRGLEPLEQGIQAWLDERKSKPGVRHAAIRWIERITAPIAAYMTLKCVLDGITKRREYTVICAEISDLILDELRYRRLQAKAPALFAYKMANFHTSSYAHMARSLDHTVRTAKDKEGHLIDTSDLQMTPQQRVLVGAKLIEILTGLDASLVTVTSRKKPTAKQHWKATFYLEATEETSAWLEDRTGEMAQFQQLNMPMIYPPGQWEPGKRGGYRFALRGKYSLVRGLHNQAQRHDVENNTDMPMVYAALNTLQNTAWKVNATVYDLIQYIVEQGGGIAGIPLSEPTPEPNKPYDIDTNEVALQQWKKKAGRVKDKNHMRKLHAREVQRILGTTSSVLDEEAIFFPYSLDFRGRIYPLADYLHPQSNDLAKALLTFAEGKPIDERGARWLAIHGANCLGETPESKVSRMTLDDRVEWIHRHTHEIIQAADNPLAHRWWADADEPLQFYAFCVEWRNLVRANDKEVEYVCSLPVSMDGSCNGLQHFSAMMRDEVGARAVNVAPQATPQDIYQCIADVVLDKLEELAPTTPLAAMLLHSNIVTRKLTKRPTMTFGYGSKQYGFKQQIKEYIAGLDNAHDVLELLGDDVSLASSLLAKLIWQALQESVVKAVETMKWMQDCARHIVKTGRAVSWTVPITGFRVRQEYVMWVSLRTVHTVLAGSMVKPRISIATDKLNPVKQANAVSPNIIHSLDAAALMLTITQAAAEGVEAFAMVHDSYGTLPADAEVLAGCCRQSFVRLYVSNDVVTQLYEQFAAQLVDPSKCSPPPAKGNLDVSAVLASDYFFA